MKPISLGLAASIAATGAFAASTDIENNARRTVLDYLPKQADGTSWPVEVTRLQIRDLAAGSFGISAACGTLDFRNSDEGLTKFVVFYMTDSAGRTIWTGRPFLYGSIPVANPDPQYGAAQTACGGTDDREQASDTSR